MSEFFFNLTKIEIHLKKIIKKARAEQIRPGLVKIGLNAVTAYKKPCTFNRH